MSFAAAPAPSPRKDAQSMAPALLPATPRVAHIVSVSGAQAVAVLEANTQAGGGEERVEIGSMVSIPTTRTVVLGLVSAMSVPMPDANRDKDTISLIELNLAGELVADVDGDPMFKRGVSCLPSIGDAVHMADGKALTLVYASPDSATVEVGSLFQNPSVPARLLIDDLFGKHFIIVGTTGCGKSSALTCILQSLMPEYRHSRMVILDVHNEYANAFGDQAEVIDPTNLNLPFWLLNFQELSKAFITGDHQEEAELEILTDAVLAAKRRYSESATGRLRRAVESHSVTIDTPVPFRLSDVVSQIDDHLGRLDRTISTLPYRRLKARIETLVSDARYSFMFGNLMIEDTMAEVLGRLFRVPVEGRPITVLNLAAVPAEIMDVVISVISRLAFDLALWSDARLPVLIVCEEAHRYAPADGNDKFLPTRQALSRIAKEGRKYGVSLALVTQRPSELDPTILSQCSTAIA
ncbi:MAG: DUF87 domain-containing protein, partial [Alphaproteobacteria bacterium]|nr:DUF87 domain-containing protein [Alphaproteobacteria bacterium]